MKYRINGRMRFQTMLLLVLISLMSPASADTELWQQYDPDSQTAIDHSEWQSILNAYLIDEHPSGVSRFNYAVVSDADKKVLIAYIESLQAVDPSTLNKNEQLAYWINFYNAGTVHVILENYPVKSIRNIRPDFFALSLGPWDHAYFAVAGKELTLNDIEHVILRPIWQEPRLHFVLNCASIGCPNLSKLAFSAANAQTQLESSTEAFLTHSRAVFLDGDTLKLSSLFDWYADDFGADLTEVLEFISDYSELAELENGPESLDIEFHYDWSLNQP